MDAATFQVAANWRTNSRIEQVRSGVAALNGKLPGGGDGGLQREAAANGVSLWGLRVQQSLADGAFQQSTALCKTGGGIAGMHDAHIVAQGFQCGLGSSAANPQGQGHEHDGGSD
jgi:hypothetical protein